MSHTVRRRPEPAAGTLLAVSSMRPLLYRLLVINLTLSAALLLLAFLAGLVWVGWALGDGRMP
jgi:hypothetical protein